MQSEKSPAPGRRERSEPVSRDTFEIIQAMKNPGCPVCTLTLSAVMARLDDLSEAVTDPDARAALRDSLAFCAVHGREWLARNDALGTAIIYNDVLNKLRQVLRSRDAPENEGSNGGIGERLQSLFSNGRSSSDAGASLARSLEPSAACPACAYSLEIEARLSEAFVRGLGSRDFIEVYERHPSGLCLPHVRAVLRRPASPSYIETIARVQEAAWAKTSQQLSEVIRKFDYRYQDEDRGEEFAAPARAVEQASGRLPTHVNPPPTS